MDSIVHILYYPWGGLMAAGYLIRSHLLWVISLDRRAKGSHLVVDPVDPAVGINRPLSIWDKILQLGRLSSTSTVA